MLSGITRHHPFQTLKLLRRFFRYMRTRDVLYLLFKPFLGTKKGATKAEVVSRAVEHGAQKDEAALMTLSVLEPAPA